MIKSIRLITASSFFAMFFMGVGSAIIGAASRDIGLTAVQIGLLIAAQNVGFIFSVTISGARADTHPKPKILLIGSIILGTAPQRTRPVCGHSISSMVTRQLPGNFADYPCLGFNKTWIVITASMFTTASTPVYQGARMWVIDKTSALAGGSLTLTTFRTKFDLVGGVSGFTLQPCVTYGGDATLYVVDNTGYFRSSDTTFLLRLSRITGTGPAPVWSVVS